TGRRRIDCEIPKTEFVAFSFLLPCVSHRAGRVRRSGGPIHLTTTGSGRATDAGTAAATRRADRIVSGCFGCSGSRSLHLSRPDCRSRPLDAAAYHYHGPANGSVSPSAHTG